VPTSRPSTEQVPGRPSFTPSSAKQSALGAWLVGPADSIDWQPAHAGHRYLLQHFVCTTPVKADWDRQRRAYVHPYPWELEVQSYLRDLKPPVRAKTALLLGTSHGRLIAVSHYGWDVLEEQFIIWAVARSVHASGAGVGSALIERALYHLRQTKAAEDVDCGVFTRIDRRNGASKAAFASAGFDCLGPVPDDDYLEMWVHPLDL
jgi:hypothetical protein